MTHGFVSLVGAGPGDPDLITVKGVQRLQQADVVVYDYLANAELLGYCRPDAERIYVGKQANRHTLTQDAINALLVDHGRAGKRVVRLKGGDPYIFGRGGEEAESLTAAGIAWEVVPGISAGVAAPAYAGIPVTHREVASSVAFITGHEDPTKPETALNWRTLATAVDTLVFYMGVGNLPEIAARLIEHGRPAETPVAVIRWGTLPQQEVVSGTLATIAADVAAAGLRPPAITVVGEVVRLREKLGDLIDRAAPSASGQGGPLQGKRIVVTRAREQASALSERLREAGAEPIEYPVIAFAPPEDWEPLDQALRQIDAYDWVIFTSVNGVKFVTERMQQLGLDLARLGARKIGAIGPATAAELRQAGFTPEFVPREFVAEAVIAQIGDVSGQRVLLPRADLAREALGTGLTAKGAQVDNVTAYRTVLGEADADVVGLLQNGQIDAVTFTSSSTVNNFFARLEQSGVTPQMVRRLLEPVTIAAIGPITAKTAYEHGLKVAIEAERYTIDGLMGALVEAFGVVEAQRA
jgi:uroporphyrinogen III methyltransferase/synthase